MCCYAITVACQHPPDPLSSMRCQKQGHDERAVALYARPEDGSQTRKLGPHGEERFDLLGAATLSVDS